MGLFDFLKKKKTSTTKKAPIHRARRVQLIPLHRLVFLAKDSSAYPDLKIVNLSVSGVGFQRDDRPEWPPLGTVIDGEFLVEGKSVPARIRLVHQTDRVIGGPFEGGMHELQRMVMRYCEVELAALTMTEVRPEILRETDEGTPRWFRGAENCELYFILDPTQKHLIRFTISFFGNYIEGAPDSPVKYGQIISEGEGGKPHYSGSEMIEFQEKLPPSLAEAATKLVENIDQLDSALRTEIGQILRRT